MTFAGLLEAVGEYLENTINAIIKTMNQKYKKWFTTTRT
jgi:hypothetical protein